MTRTNDNGIDRKMTASEEADYETWVAIEQAEQEAETAAEATKAKAKADLLNKLGITADEAALLLG